MSYAEHVVEDRRLVLLKLLEPAAQYTAPAILLQRSCARVGHSASAAAIETDLAWLAEQGLVVTRKADGVTIATLTVRGLDVGTGRATVPGVAQPQPGH